MGTPGKTVQPCEAASQTAIRRSIVAAHDLKAGATIAVADLKWIRPGDGLRPGNEAMLLGRRLKPRICAKTTRSRLPTWSNRPMCGIAGYFGSDPPPAERVERCLHLMRRRGPDAAASYRFTNSIGRQAVLLHTRLSIIDLDERANQPFRVGSQVLAYNGELYTSVELRRDVVAAGQKYQPERDTEVLLKTLIQFGIAGLDRCEGMWAFALFNEADGSLLLSRDRFGEKPLYLFRDAAGFYFGSEVKFLAALRGKAFDVNEGHLYRYLVNGYKSLYKTGETFFRGVSELPPGMTALRVDCARAAKSSSDDTVAADVRAG